MSEYLDEKILDLMNEQEELEEKKKIDESAYGEQLRKGVLEGRAAIRDKIIRFEEKKLMNDKFKIHIPKTFEVMSTKEASLKYPSERRPGLIFTNVKTSINISFNHTNSAVNDNDIGSFKDAMQEILKKAQPSAEWLESDVNEINGKSVSFFDFISPALDTDIYNFVFFAELYGKALMCSINCTKEEMGDWKHIARGVMDSFKVCPPKEQNF